MKTSRKCQLFIICFVLICALSITAQDYSGTVVNQANGSPVKDVLVSLGHSEFYTHTDSDGKFTLSTTTSIGYARTASKMRSVRARWNFRKRTIDLRSAPDVNSISIYTVNGKRIFNGRVPPSRVIDVPSLAKGTYLLDLRGEQGLRGSARVIMSNQAASSFTFRSATLSGGTTRLNKSAQTSSSPERLIFRHDDYYPKDINADGSNNNISVSLKPDDRSFVFDQSKVREYRFRRFGKIGRRGVEGRVCVGEYDIRGYRLRNGGASL